MKKQIVYILITLVITALLTQSCKTPEPEVILTLSVASIGATADLNSYEVKVTTTAPQFTATSDADWCKVTTDVAQKNISISITKNTVSESRKAKVTVTAGTKTATVSVTQAAGVYVPPVYTPTNRDSVALINLNNGTTKWNTAQPFNTWTGVKVEMVNGFRRVTELNLPNTNYVTGAVSDSIKNLTEAMYIDLSTCNLTGSLPALSSLSKLIVLDCKNNKLTGSIPTLPASLSYLSLGQNNFSGSLPVQLKDLTNLIVFDLGLNDFTGAVPVEWSVLTKIKYFYMYGNQLSGSMPSFLATYSKLEALAMDYNQLTGSIPLGIGLIVSLNQLTLQQNKLSGTIPSDLLNNTHWATWSATVIPQQNGVSLSATKSQNQTVKIKLIKSLPNSYAYYLETKNRN